MSKPSATAQTDTKEQKEQKDTRPVVLILGGCGFVGRNLVKYLYDSKVASKIRVVDKARPETSYFNDIHKVPFSDKSVVEFIQGDLSKDPTVDKIFKMGADYVINVCGETRPGLQENDYKVKSYDTAVKCGTAAAKYGVKKFVEVSTGHVYEPASRPATEDSKLAPWSVQGKYRLKAEEDLKKINGLPLVILRPAIIYGAADLTGLTPRIVCAAIYKKTNKTMKLLWGKELHVNVVHVNDVCRALWAAATELKPGSVYNLADQTDLNQGKLTDCLARIFNIKTDFFGDTLSNLANRNLRSITDDANSEHVSQWQSICLEYKINNTPLSPFIDPESLSKSPSCIDGSKILKESTSFKTYTNFTEELLKEQIAFFTKQGLFPAFV